MNAARVGLANTDSVSALCTCAKHIMISSVWNTFIPPRICISINQTYNIKVDMIHLLVIINAPSPQFIPSAESGMPQRARVHIRRVSELRCKHVGAAVS